MRISVFSFKKVIAIFFFFSVFEQATAMRPKLASQSAPAMQPRLASESAPAMWPRLASDSQASSLSLSQSSLFLCFCLPRYQGSAMCCYFSHCCDQILTKSNLKKGGFLLAYHSRDTVQQG